LRRSVVASDLDTRWVGELSRPNLEVRVHDLLEDDLTAFAVFGTPSHRARSCFVLASGSALRPASTAAPFPIRDVGVLVALWVYVTIAAARSQAG
jgi:hypothetical protein